MTRENLLCEFATEIANVRRDHPVRVAIDGVDASGKTTFADELVRPLQRLGRSVIRSSVDHFHNPRAIRLRRGDTSPDGYYHDSFDYAELARILLKPLGPGGSCAYRAAFFDHRTDSPVDAPVERAGKDAVLLFDGVFLHRPELREFWDWSIFLRANFETTVERAESRDLELLGSATNVRERYAGRYVPGQKLYLAEVQPEKWASCVIDNNDLDNPRVIARISENSSGQT